MKLRKFSSQLYSGKPEINGEVFQPDYFYNLEKAEEIPDIVLKESGSWE